jgi:pyruvate, water dikinase
MKRESEFILWFSDINMNSLSRVGGKAASLGEMFNMKLPIPNGFCVTADAYKYFLEETNIKNKISKLIKDLDVENTDILEETAKKIQYTITEQDIPMKIKNNILESYELMNIDSGLVNAGQSALNLIKAGRDPPYVAVRSSATAEDLPNASFAGQQETFLNIKGSKNVLEAVKKCWASLFTARAIYYRTKNNFDHMKVYLCVIVHKMINGDVSGVMFTANPTNNDETEIMIEASYGVGETIVSGSVNPDNYMVDKESLEIKSIKIHKKDFMITRDENNGKNKTVKLDDEKANSQSLDEFRIKELAKYGLIIEKHYKKPMDIEWGVERNKLYILQARPITTLKKEHKKTEELEGEILLEGLNASPGIASGAVKIVKDISELDKIQQGDVLVTKMTSPDYVVSMKKAFAIVTDEGGLTSHASIVSRELGIPAVVGTEKATHILKENEIITVDGNTGKIYKGDLGIKSERIEDWQGEKLETKTKIYMNLGEPELAERYKNLPFDGIGLMRLEFLIISYIGKHPLYMIKTGKGNEYVNKLSEGISKVAKAIHPKPMIVRFTDFKTNEYHNLEGGAEYEEKEDNPMMGWRGVSRYISEDYVEAFKLELKAIKKVREHYDNVHVMLPFVRTIWEVRKVLGIMANEGLTRDDNFKIYLMAEVPAMALIPEDFAKLDVDGVSIGSNDLTQGVLCIDRDSRKLTKLGYFDERNKAVLKAMSNILKTFRENGKSIGICGQAPSNYPEIVKFLVEHNIDSVSVNPDVVVKTMKLVYEIENS